MIINDVELWYIRLGSPNPRFNKTNPTYEVQIRTQDKKKADELKAQGVPMKAEIPEEGAPFWRANIKRNKFNRDGDESKPPEVVDGHNNQLDPYTIGSGSRGNVRVYQYPYAEGQKTGNVLMGVQITHLKFVKPRPREDFAEAGETVIEYAEEPENSEESAPQEEQKSTDPYAPAAPKLNAPAAPSLSPPSSEPEDDIPF